jgi:YD repeat-containing protein
VVYTTDPNGDIVESVNRRGRIWTYTRSSTATELTTVVTDPQNRQSTYVFDATTVSVRRRPC